MKPQTVDEYLKNCPPHYAPLLTQLRRLIKKTAPEASERLSYGMPFYEYHGRLVYFALFKNHLGLFLPPPIIENHSEDLKSYKTTKSSVHLLLDKKLPIALIKKLIKARMRWNEEIAKKKLKI